MEVWLGHFINLHYYLTGKAASNIPVFCNKGMYTNTCWTYR